MSKMDTFLSASALTLQAVVVQDGTDRLAVGVVLQQKRVAAAITSY